jgi:hypothetical protein
MMPRLLAFGTIISFLAYFAAERAHTAHDDALVSRLSVCLMHHYDGVDLSAVVEGERVLRMSLVAARARGVGDDQILASLRLKMAQFHINCDL